MILLLSVGMSAKRAFRAASSASLRDTLTVWLDLGAVNVPDGVTDDVDEFDLSALPDSEWPPDITVLVSELVVVAIVVLFFVV